MFVIFFSLNIYAQQERFDLDCKYIKKWVPELQKMKSKTIHELWKIFPDNLEYPKPILIHKIEADKTKLIFKLQK